MSRKTDLITGATSQDGIYLAEPLLEKGSKLAKLGWTSKTTLSEGIRDTYVWFAAHHAEARH